jgi:ATP adenylyltransferase
MPYSPPCPFCSPELHAGALCRIGSAFAIYDKYPVSPGHILIIPYRHEASWFELSPPEQQDCWQLVNQCREIILKSHSPDGFNIGININEAAGQSIFHVHIHLIPRYKGDVENPFGGVRGVIPVNRKY